MDKTFFEKLKTIEKENPAFFNSTGKHLIHYISIKTTPKGNALLKSDLIVSKDLPKEIAEKVQVILS